MACQPDDAGARDRRVQAILHDYLLALDQGHAPERDEVLRQHPELADELQALFADQGRLDALARPVPVASAAPPSGGPAPVGDEYERRGVPPAADGRTVARRAAGPARRPAPPHGLRRMRAGVSRRPVPLAVTMRPVQDDSNAPEGAGPYGACAPAEARRSPDEVECHGTPEHGRGPTGAAAGVTASRCPGRRLGRAETRAADVAAGGPPLREADRRGRWPRPQAGRWAEGAGGQVPPGPHIVVALRGPGGVADRGGLGLGAPARQAFGGAGARGAAGGLGGAAQGGGARCGALPRVAGQQDWRAAPGKGRSGARAACAGAARGRTKSGAFIPGG